MNKKHYTMMNRATKNFFVNYCHTKGAKVHFNYGIKFEDEELATQTGEKQELIVMKIIINMIEGCEIWSGSV
jgi:hypothetical protein